MERLISAALLSGCTAYSTPAAPQEGQWQVRADFGGIRDRAITTDKAWVYDPAKDQWSPLRDLPAPTMNGFAAASGGHIYVGLGYNRQGKDGKGIKDHFRTLYRYDPAADSHEMPRMRCCGGGGVVGDTLVVTGGFFGTGDLGNVCKPTWIYTCRQ